MVVNCIQESLKALLSKCVKFHNSVRDDHYDEDNTKI